MTQLIVNDQVLLESPGLILFDKDGTLLDIHHYWVSMIRLRADLISECLFNGNEVRAKVKKALISAMGVDQETERMKPEGPVGVKPRPYIVDVAVQIVREFGASSDVVTMEATFKEIDQSTARNMLPLLKCLPGVVGLLDQLKKHGVPAAIVTTDITERACKAMETLGLSDYFIDIVGGDAVAKTKPSPDLAEYVILNNKLLADNVVVIGDHPVDIEMGLATGVRINIGVLTGLSDSAAFNNLDCATVQDLTMVQVR
jgi:phosphoglycolate phosphatase